MSIFRTAVVAAGILVASAAAQAATVSYGTTPASTSTLTTGLQTTNFTSSLTLPKFNSTLGTLTSVAIDFAGGVTSTIKFESLDAAPSTIIGTASVNRPTTLTPAILDLKMLLLTEKLDVWRGHNRRRL
jgi:hypothetical protein